MRTGSDGIQVMETPAEMVAGLVHAAQQRKHITIAGVEYAPVSENEVIPDRDLYESLASEVSRFVHDPWVAHHFADRILSIVRESSPKPA